MPNKQKASEAEHHLELWSNDHGRSTPRRANVIPQHTEGVRWHEEVSRGWPQTTPTLMMGEALGRQIMLREGIPLTGRVGVVEGALVWIEMEDVG